MEFFVPTLASYVAILTLLGVGAVVSLLALGVPAVRPYVRVVAHGSALLAGVVGVVVGIAQLMAGTVLSASYPSLIPLFSWSVRIDGLAAFFIVLVSLGVSAASLYGIGFTKRAHGLRHASFGVAYTVFIASLYGVAGANDGIMFLVAWELMSLASYFLIVHEGQKEQVRAGLLYLLMTQVGTAFLTLAIVLVGSALGSYSFDAFRIAGGSIAPLVQHLALGAALIGLGMKAGVVPLHIWLPEAHPAAPAHVSALLSGVMLKLAILMLVRFFFDFFTLGTVWWGVVLLLIGATSSLLGVLYALAEHDLKRLLAYHSVENIGIIFLGIGSAAIFTVLGSPYALLALAAALFHSLNHAIFKGLLFLGAGSVVQATGTHNMERYGGLIRVLPATATLFLVGSVAISGLPPLNGFASELATFQALIAGAALSSLALKALFVLALGSLALTSGLAAACFVKAVGTTFLARPRSPLPTHHVELGSMVAGMAFLAALTLLLGVVGKQVLERIGAIIKPFLVQPLVPPLPLAIASVPSFAVVFVALLGFGALVFLVHAALRARRVTVGPVWGCGAPMESPLFAGPLERAEITATSFSRLLLIVYKRLVPTVVSREAHADILHPLSTEAHLEDWWRTHLYGPLRSAFLRAGAYIRMLQGGNVNAYFLYILLTLCIVLFTVL